MVFTVKKVLVVDDSFFVRRVLKEMISDFDGFSVFETARNGKEALEVLDQNPDLDAMTLDVEMPEMDGLATLKTVRDRGNNIPVLMVSALTEDQAQVTSEALELGADDVIAKPSGSSVDGMEDIEDELREKLFALTRYDRRKQRKSNEDTQHQNSEENEYASKSLDEKLNVVEPKAVVIGGSTGAPNVISDIISYLPEKFPLPVLVVQHIAEPFLSTFASRLDSKSKLDVEQVNFSRPLEAGTVYLPADDQHLVVSGDPSSPRVKKDRGEAEYSAKPSVHVLFESARETFGRDVIAILLTGMGEDGAKATRRLHQAGALCMIQDEETSSVFGMPGKAAALGGFDLQVPDTRIPKILIDWTVSSRKDDRPEIDSLESE